MSKEIIISSLSKVPAGKKVRATIGINVNQDGIPEGAYILGQLQSMKPVYMDVSGTTDEVWEVFEGTFKVTMKDADDKPFEAIKTALLPPDAKVKEGSQYRIQKTFRKGKNGNTYPGYQMIAN